jgi:hypothetical protein
MSQECPECGDVRARVRHTGHDELGRVVRQRVCPEGHKFGTIEVNLPPTATFHKVAVDTRPERPTKTERRRSAPRNPIVVRYYYKPPEGGPLVEAQEWPTNENSYLWGVPDEERGRWRPAVEAMVTGAIVEAMVAGALADGD